jgi:hypothetical protein
MSTTISVDYLIIGAGAMGMAFADVLAAESDFTMAIVDRNDAPGGHWTMSYPFVRLHGPSRVYGTNSTFMVSDNRDTNSNLASGHEVLDYYDRVMRETLLASGRVTYLPRHNVEDIGAAGPLSARARSLVSGQIKEILVAKRIVDASYMNIAVPAMCRRGYQVDPDAPVIPVGQLAELQETPRRYTILGSGKTGIDACLWLLSHGVDPDSITWVSPRDAWLVNRASKVQSRDVDSLFALSDCTSIVDAQLTMEDLGVVMRRDPHNLPSAFRCATVDPKELAALRQIERVVQLGRVRHVGATRVELDQGSVTSEPGTVYVDCTASGLTQKPLKPVFDKAKITLQPLLACLLPISAAVPAKLETLDLNDELRNGICEPVANPNDARDLVDFFRIRHDRMDRWSTSPLLRDWLAGSRLGAALAGQERLDDVDFRTENARMVAHLGHLLKEES